MYYKKYNVWWNIIKVSCFITYNKSITYSLSNYRVLWTKTLDLFLIDLITNYEGNGSSEVIYYKLFLSIIILKHY